MGCTWPPGLHGPEDPARKRPKEDEESQKESQEEEENYSSSRDYSTGSESVKFLDDLQLQCGLKPKHMNLKDLVRLDDLKPVA
jgi:hypothetical protein